MTPDDTTSGTEPVVESGAQAAPERSAIPDVAPHAAGSVEATSVQANLSAIVTVQADDFEAVGSAILFANVGRDAAVTASATPIVHAKGDITVRQTYASAVIAGGDMEISQAAAPIIIGKQLSVNQGGGCVLLAGDAQVSNGFVGVLLSPKATVSDDSKVLLSTQAALIIAAALFGGFALVAVVMVLGAKRVMSWRPHLDVSRFQVPQLPDVETLMRKLGQHHAA